MLTVTGDISPMSFLLTVTKPNGPVLVKAKTGGIRIDGM
jgi:hypothetical protein